MRSADGANLPPSEATNAHVPARPPPRGFGEAAAELKAPALTLKSRMGVAAQKNASTDREVSIDKSASARHRSKYAS